MKFKLLLALLLTIISCSSNARSYTKTEVASTAIIAGSFFAMMMHTDCTYASADLWDMEDKDRASYKCPDIFKGFKDYNGLAIYKKSSAVASRSYSKLKKALIVSSIAAGGSGEPPKGCDAHHIVPEKEGRVWAKEFAEGSRRILSECNIDINSEENGVFLPNGKNDSAGCEGSHHPSVHTKANYADVYNRLLDAKANGGCTEVRNALNYLKENLIKGSM